MICIFKAQALKAVRKNGMNLSKLSKKWQNDLDVVLAAVSQNGKAIRYGHPRFTRDKMVMMAAVTNDGMAIYYGTPSIRGNKDVAMVALKQAPEAFDFILPELKKDDEILIAAGMAVSEKKEENNTEENADKSVKMEKIFNKFNSMETNIETLSNQAGLQKNYSNNDVLEFDDDEMQS